MKNLLPLFFLGFTSGTMAQVNSVMPPEAYTFYNNAMKVVKPGIKNIIEKNANKLKGRNVNMDSLSNELHKDQLLKNTGQGDLQAITVLIMVQISKDADTDLKNLVLRTHKDLNNQKDQGVNENTQARVEGILANKSHLAENVSVVMKKLSGSQQIVIDQLK